MMITEKLIDWGRLSQEQKEDFIKTRSPKQLIHFMDSMRNNSEMFFNQKEAVKQENAELRRTIEFLKIL